MNVSLEKHKVQIMNKRKSDTCLLEFCDKEFYAKGFCQRHYYHWKRCQPLVDYTKEKPQISDWDKKENPSHDS